ncbi:hypothetical protein ABB07_12510 [Streptomyces incarnatus]|uniref:Tn3 transposase DDE domain-containing protein n=1 Tax=Streptomyces incarnatus TaxID=665007 RepID=A0ABM5TIM0_9ACTN|nr:hypothetical protein ABB07_12510 [Streptomyces incarnatus]
MIEGLGGGLRISDRFGQMQKHIRFSEYVSRGIYIDTDELYSLIRFSISECHISRKGIGEQQRLQKESAHAGRGIQYGGTFG